MSEDQHDILNDSLGEERKKERNISYNNIIYDNLFNKPQIVRSISFTKAEYPKLAMFIEKAQLERQTFQQKTGFSALVKKAMWDYLKAHPLPNPQVTLQRSLNLNMPVKPTNACCVPHCRTTARYILILKNFENTVERFPVCHKHRNWKHREFRWLVGKKELKP